MSEGGGKVQRPLNHRGILRLKNYVGVGGGGYKKDKWSWTKCNKKREKRLKTKPGKSINYNRTYYRVSYL